MGDETAASHRFATPAEALLAQPPARGLRVVTLTLCLFAVAAIAYAALAPVDVVVTALGRVVPSGKTVLVQAQRSGVLADIAATDGQRVTAGGRLGQILPSADATVEASLMRANLARSVARRMAQTGTGPNGALLDSRLFETLSKLATLDADVTRRRAERDALTRVIAELEKSMALVARKHAMRERLARSGHLPQTNLIDSKLELINFQKELYVQRQRLQEAEAALHAALHARAQAELEYQARYPAELVEVVRHRVPVSEDTETGSSILRAPIDGVVRWLVPLAAGDPVSAGQALMVIVPEHTLLEVEALVFNKDIGHIKVGQRAIVKAETYDFTRYGYIEGSVQWVGLDAISDPKLGPVYATRIALAAYETPYQVNGQRGRLAPGMNVTVDVRVAERRMIEYFLSPLLRYKQESLREH